MSATFEFVPAGRSGRPKPADRARIRSRCMQGRNKREDSRRSLREARRFDASSANYSSSASRMPPPPPRDLALVQLVANVGPPSQDTLFKIFTCNVLNQAMSPLEPCVDYNYVETACFHWLFEDVAFLHALLFIGSMMDDLVSHKQPQPGRKTYAHLRQTIAALNTALCAKDAHLKDSTLYVVIALTSLAVASRDLRAAAAHMDGLRKIVQLRGGLEYLAQRPKLHFKLDRIDLAWTLSSGEKPRFLPRSTSRGPLFMTAERVPMPRTVQSIDGLVDARLGIVYEDLQRLTFGLNESAQKHERWNVGAFQNVITCIQSQLLRLEDNLKDSPSECLRLAMLAFLTTLFKIPGRNTPYTYLAKRLRSLYPTVFEGTLSNGASSLHFWFIMVGTITVVDPDEEWLVQMFTAVHASPLSWEEAKKRLLSVMWIECIHDAPAKRMFEQLTARAQKYH